ncbi:unnamed protein product [Caenorhabditis angaria]|uniref:Peptidase M13 C-terminal domain-containing protein n=1 Tax=Caenorhabditis angaria TaxID=860376 RepID=A0A9P1I8P5_9PELO|nr:unnamed protein product [Caenorhabditis angaria]
MVLFMDNSTDPCTDFYKFSCGNYDKNVDPNKNHVIEIYNKQDVNRDIFSKYLNFSTLKSKTTPEKIAMTLWKKCVETTSVEIYETDIWKKLDFTDILLEMAKVSITKTRFLKNDIYPSIITDGEHRLGLTLKSGIQEVFAWDYFLCHSFVIAKSPDEIEEKLKSGQTTSDFKFFDIKKYMKELLPEYAQNTTWSLIYHKNELIALEKLVNLKGVETIRDKLKPFYDEALEKYVVSDNFTGIDRENECYKTIEKMFPGTLAMMFIEQFVPKQNLEKANQLVDEVKEVFREMIEENDWMEQELKDGLKNEIDLIKSSIGIPDEYKDMKNIEKMYESVQKTKPAEQQTYLELVRNLLAMNSEETFLRVAREEQIKYSGNPIYVSSNFRIGSHRTSIPPIVLNFPYIDSDLPHWNMIAALGFMISHEIGHPFDADSFEHDSLLVNYPMSPKNRKEFKKRVDCIISKYSKYTFSDGTFSDGKKSQSEDTADKIGIDLVSRILKKLLITEKQQKLPILAEYSVEQQFFMRVAHEWCGMNFVGEYLKKAKKHVHSIGEFRINGMMSNTAAFAKAFKCAEKTPMNPEKKCPLYDSH